MPEISVLLAVLLPERPLTALTQLPLEDATRADIIARSVSMLNTGPRTTAQTAAANVAMTQAKNNPIVELFCTNDNVGTDVSYLEAAITIMVNAGLMRDECVFIEEPTHFGSAIRDLSEDINAQLDHFVGAFQTAQAQSKPIGAAATAVKSTPP
eukprot:1977995-Amphidinium_carterae.1